MLNHGDYKIFRRKKTKDSIAATVGTLSELYWARVGSIFKDPSKSSKIDSVSNILLEALGHGFCKQRAILEITTITKPTIQNEEIIEKIINSYVHSRLKGLLNPISIAQATLRAIAAVLHD